MTEITEAEQRVLDALGRYIKTDGFMKAIVEDAVLAALRAYGRSERAAMPCYDKWTGETVEACPSCQARSEESE